MLLQHFIFNTENYDLTGRNNGNLSLTHLSDNGDYTILLFALTKKPLMIVITWQRACSLPNIVLTIWFVYICPSLNVWRFYENSGSLLPQCLTGFLECRELFRLDLVFASHLFVLQSDLLIDPRLSRRKNGKTTSLRSMNWRITTRLNSELHHLYCTPSHNNRDSPHSLARLTLSHIQLSQQLLNIIKEVHSLLSAENYTWLRKENKL